MLEDVAFFLLSLQPRQAAVLLVSRALDGHRDVGRLLDAVVLAESSDLGQEARAGVEYRLVSSRSCTAGRLRQWRRGRALTPKDAEKIQSELFRNLDTSSGWLADIGGSGPGLPPVPVAADRPVTILLSLVSSLVTLVSTGVLTREGAMQLLCKEPKGSEYSPRGMEAPT